MLPLRHTPSCMLYTCSSPTTSLGCSSLSRSACACLAGRMSCGRYREILAPPGPNRVFCSPWDRRCRCWCLFSAGVSASRYVGAALPSAGTPQPIVSDGRESCGCAEHGNHATSRVCHWAVRPGLRRRECSVKVLMLTYSLANGGLERQLSLLARNLPPQWQCRMWTLEGGPHADAVMAAGIPLAVRPRRARFDVAPAVHLSRLIHSWRPDVVHAWHWMPATAAVPACVALRIPLVDGSIRMGSVPRSLGRPRRGIMHFATLVVANSSAGLAAWRISPDKGRVIYNAFEGERMHAVSSQRPAVPGGDPFTVIMAARMAPPKDYATAIRAVRLLAEPGSLRWRFLFVGDGPDRSALLEEASDLVAAGVVAFPAGELRSSGTFAARMLVSSSLIRTCSLKVAPTRSWSTWRVAYQSFARTVGDAGRLCEMVSPA